MHSQAAADLVRTFLRQLLALGLSLGCLSTGCHRSTPLCEETAAAATNLPPDTLAIVDGRPVPLERWKPPRLTSGTTSAEAQARKSLADLLLREQLIARALRAGLDRDADVRRSFENALIAKLKEREVASHWHDAPSDPSPWAVSARSAASASAQDQVRLAMLRLDASPKATPEKRAHLESRLQKARTLAGGHVPIPEGFGALAMTHSDDTATRMRGGDLGWLEADPTRYHLDSNVLSAGLALTTPGEISPVVHGKSGLYLVRLIDRKPAAARPDPTVSPEWARHRALMDQRKVAEATMLEETRRMIPVTLNAPLVEQRIAALTARPAPASGPPSSPSSISADAHAAEITSSRLHGGGENSPDPGIQWVRDGTDAEEMPTSAPSSPAQFP